MQELEQIGTAEGRAVCVAFFERFEELELNEAAPYSNVGIVFAREVSEIDGRRYVSALLKQGCRGFGFSGPSRRTLENMTDRLCIEFFERLGEEPSKDNVILTWVEDDTDKLVRSTLMFDIGDRWQPFSSSMILIEGTPGREWLLGGLDEFLD